MKKQYLKFQSSISQSKKIAALLLLFLTTTIMSGQAIRYVKQGGNGNGSSWATASGNLQAMIDASASNPAANDEVWVAQGTYNIPELHMKSHVKIYGGFPSANGAAGMADRNTGLYTSIIFGRIYNNGGVMEGWLDGFTVTHALSGYADPVHHYGGGMYNVNSTIHVANCVFKGNAALYIGGAIFQQGGSLTVENTLFFNNVGGGDAGAIMLYYTTATLTNVTITANRSYYLLANFGGDVAPLKVINSSLALNNSIIYGNTYMVDNQHTVGYEMVFYAGSEAIVRNSIFGEVGYGTEPGSAQPVATFYNCSGDDPMFTDGGNGPFRLHYMSPAINAADPTLFSGSAQDAVGDPRINDGQIDMGAVEIQPFDIPRRYVKEGANGVGTSWGNPSGNLQQMIDSSLPGRDVWVARGDYQAEAGQTFVLREGVKVYGGFPDDDNNAGMADRDWKMNVTTLHGNNNRVVVANELSAATTLDGFVITGGVTAGDGGGIYYEASRAVLKNLTVTGNSAAGNGGGIFLYCSHAIPEEFPATITLENIILKDNNALYGGGLYFNNYERLNLDILNSEFSSNTAYGAGGLFCVNGRQRVINTVFASNTTVSEAAFHLRSDKDPEFINCTITGNTATEQGGITYLTEVSNLNFRNCILWGNSPLGEPYELQNPQYYHYNIQNSLTDGGADPLFANAANGNYRLTASSPAIDAGNTSFFPNAASTSDLGDNPRLNGASIDMGAYEYKLAECGDILTVWNGGSWNNGVPLSYEYSAVIDGDYNSSVNGEVTACALKINNSVVVNSDDVFTISGAVMVSPSASLKFENNAHLMQEGTTNTNSGTIEMHRNSSQLFRQDYTMWSSPVGGQGLRDFSAETLFNRFYSYNPVTNHLVGIFPDAAAQDVDFETGRGYLIRMPNGAPEAGYVEGTTAIIYDGTFTGIPNNGNIAVAVTPAAGQVLGYNAIGNPYPSPISIPAFFAANNGNTDGTIYLWRRKNGSDAASAYCTVNSLGEYVGNGQLETENPNGFIQTGQGFIVKALGNTINFNNSMRSATTDHDGSFFRMNDTQTNTGTGTETLDEAHRIWLNLSKENAQIAQMLLGYRSNATMGIDMGIDAPFINDVETGLNSIIDDKAYAIQGRSLPFDAQDIVPLQFKTNVAGSYSIAIDHLDGLFLGSQDIYLKDNLLGVTHDIKASGYSFTSGAGVFDTRFEIVYVTNALGNNEPEIDANTIIIYKQDKNLVLNSGTAVMANVKVFDTRGRLVYERDNINASETVISDLRAEEQLLIVQVTTVKNAKVSRKVIY